MKPQIPMRFLAVPAAVLISTVLIASCSGGGGDGGGGPVPPTPVPVGTAARLVAITTSMPTPTNLLFATPGTATGKLAVNMDTGEIGGAVLYSGLSSSTIAASIRDSTADPNSLPVVSLASGTGTSGAWVVPAGTVLNQLQLGALQTGTLFLRLDTSNNAGEKRGIISLPSITLTTSLAPVAGTGSTGSGTATLAVNLGIGTLSGTVVFSGLTSNATAAHIHLRSDNSTIVTLEGGGTTTGAFSFPAGAFLNAAQLKALVNDGLYVTVNSQNFQLPVSELAGNIVYPVTTIPTVSLSRNQEVPPVTSAGVGSGTGNLTVSLGTGKLNGSVSYNFSSSTSIAAHIHQGFTGENGPPLITLEGNTGLTSGSWNVPANKFLSAGELGSLISDGLYLNVHTTGNTDGEIRGQIVNVPTN